MCFPCAETHLGLLVKQPYCFILTKIGMCQQISVCLTSIKFYENLIIGSPVGTCRQIDRRSKTNKEF